MKIATRIFEILDSIIFGLYDTTVAFFKDTGTYGQGYYYGNQYNYQPVPEASQKIKIKLNHKAFLKLKYYTKHIDIEWGGLIVSTKNGNIITVEDILISHQKASHGHFQMDLNSLGKMIEIIAEKSPKLLEKIRGWCHSHNSMGVFWSGEDNDTFDKLCDYYGDYVVGVVVNKAGEQKWRVDIKTQGFGKLVLDDLKYDVVMNDRKLEEQCKEDIIKHVKRRFL